jgi:hypothetical protein
MRTKLKNIDFSKIVSITANIAVIAGIVFLGFEVQQNNKLLEAQARHNLISQRTITNNAVRDPNLLAAMEKLNEGEELDYSEETTVSMVVSLMIENWEWQYGEYQAGLLDLEQLPVENWAFLYHDRFPIAEVWER